MSIYETLRQWGFFQVIIPFLIISFIAYLIISKLLKEKILKWLSNYIKSDTLSKWIFIILNLIISLFIGRFINVYLVQKLFFY